MNSTKLAALFDLAVGKVGEWIGHTTRNAALEASGRSRKLDAALALRRAQVAVEARVTMDTWQLADTRLRVAAL